MTFEEWFTKRFPGPIPGSYDSWELENMKMAAKEAWAAGFQAAKDLEDETFVPSEEYRKMAGDLVLDNCMGSGSTGVACKNLDRRFIGIEKEEKYFKIAQERMGLVSTEMALQESVI